MSVTSDPAFNRVKQPDSRHARIVEPLRDGDMEQVDTCQVCGGAETDFLWESYDRLYRLPGVFGMHKCRSCGLVRLSPRPTPAAISTYYPDDYGAYVTAEFSINTVRSDSFFGLRDFVRNSVLSGLDYESGKSKLQSILAPMLSRFFLTQATYGYGERFPRYVSDGCALEVGCGNGAFLSYLKNHGWHVQGIDISSVAAAEASIRYGIDVFVGAIEEAPFEKDYFDYVHLSHVVEHFFDPVSALRSIHELMKRGGTVYIEVPNSDGIGAELSGKYWYGWDTPRHLVTFSPSNLKLMLEQVGFETTKMTTIASDYFPWALTYQREDETGLKLDRRPGVNSAEHDRLSDLRKRAALMFKKDSMRGDFICCWARKV